MTHPLTPRENLTRPIVGIENRTAHEVFDIMSDRFRAHLTALASGSGDHAELARLADMADWMADGDPGANGSVLLSASVASEHASDLKGLLAEIAALRGERDRNREEYLAERQSRMEHGSREAGYLDQIERLNFRATEAERKLAEAEETNTRWAIRFAELRKAAGIGVKPMLSEVPGELRKMRSLLDRAAELMRQCTDPERFEGASTLNVYANMRAWLSDLSKEAEQ